MEFLFNRAKDRINKRKHGISLSRTSEFDFDTATFVVDDRQDYGEVRIRAIGFSMQGFFFSFSNRKAETFEPSA